MLMCSCKDVVFQWFAEGKFNVYLMLRILPAVFGERFTNDNPLTVQAKLNQRVYRAADGGLDNHSCGKQMG